jgi:hypothetical protein
MGTLGNLEIVNRGINPVFTGTAENDLCLYTETSNQRIHIGTGGSTTSTASASNAMLVVSPSNVTVNGNLQVTGTFSRGTVGRLFYTFNSGQTQTINHGVISKVDYPTLEMNEGNHGLSYSSGTFSNVSNETITILVVFNIAYNTYNSSGNRSTWCGVPNISGTRYGPSSMPSYTTSTQLNYPCVASSCILTLTANQTFEIAAYQDAGTGANLVIGFASNPTLPSRVQIIRL